MHVKRRRGWELQDRVATPERVFADRRRFLSASALALAALAAPRWARAATEADPSTSLYPAKRNPAYTLDRNVTREEVSGEFNNFYEFGSHKRIAREAQKLPIRPWTVEISGMVEQPRTVDVDALLKAMPLEERLYRHRCVEAWAMAVPWTGFPMKAFLNYARPLGSAKYVAMQTFLKPEVASGQKQFWYPWPYTEGLAIDEAANELAFLATGIYGKPLPKQFGAPLRLAIPWKYGFKSVKSIVRVEFTEKRPKSFWEEIQPEEYGFWANVNPDVPHPRWSQAQEELLGEGRKVPTLLYNGYAEQVAHLYANRQGERLFA
jgi:methionine sulfoxide reductase catalytic subunit